MIHSLTLMPTENCNMECGYCCVSKNDNILNDNDLKKAITTLFRSHDSHRERSIEISGGEPLLEYAKVRSIISYAKILASYSNYRLKISVVTNGTLLDEEKLEYFRKKKVKVIISMDGNECSNRYRKTKGGINSFSILKRKFPLFLKYKDVVWIQLTIMPDMAEHTLENFLFFKKLGFNNIAVQHAIGFFWKREEADRFLKAYKRILKLKGKGRRKKIDSDVCPKTRGHAFVDARGEVFVCKMFSFLPVEKRKGYSIGNINNPRILAKIKDAKSAFPKRFCEFFPKHKCADCNPSGACTEFCLSIDLKKRGFNQELARESLYMARELERLLGSYG